VTLRLLETVSASLLSYICFFYYLIHIVKNVKNMVNDDVSICG